MIRDSRRFYSFCLFICLICLSCKSLDSSKDLERSLLGDKGYQLFYNSENEEFLLLSSSPRVAELFRQDASISFSADWIIKSDTLIFTHFIQHFFLPRKPINGERDTVYVLYDQEFIPQLSGTPTKYLIKPDTLFRLYYVAYDFDIDSTEVYMEPFVKAEKTIIELDIPYNRDTTKLCKGS